MHAEGVGLEGDESAAELRGDVPVPRLVPYVEGAVPILVPVSQAGVAVDLVVVIEYLELQSLELYRPYRPPIAHAGKNAPPFRLLFQIQRTAAGAGAEVVGAVIYVVGDAVAVPISSAGVRGAASARPARLFGPEVVRVRDAVAVTVRAAVVLRQARLTRTVVVHIANAVAIAVGAASVLR
jgi:hypothetical protein